ncbi:O-antigen ligase family protein [Limnobacter sp. 130]|uniref:O-antigen ligase family protein n=1 Tax=Limnobacter sp. 130 TaxID=2653147 RepID=UPI001358C7B5|nr:O-antigen ligase family protein [Limnobacter sp. 130]
MGTDIAGRGTDISGNRGFMIGANEVGLMLLLTAPSVMVWIGGLKVLYKIKNFIALAIYCVSAIIVLTKSSIASILIPIANWLLHSGKNRASSGLLISVKLTSLSVLLIVLLIAYGNEIETILGKTFLSSLIDGNMLGFIFRGRSDYYEAILPGLINHDFNSIIILFGAGEGLIRSLSMAPLGRSASDATMFEMDALDLFWAYGWIGFFLYLTLIYYLIRKAKLSKLTPLHSFAIALTLIHSVLAGHVIFSPQVSTLIAFTLMLYSKRLARSTENT